MPMRRPIAALAPVGFMALTGGARAATELPGEAMGWAWVLPFIAVLLSIAAGPRFFPSIWHAHYGKIVAFWAGLGLAALVVAFGAEAAFAGFVHAMLAEYLSFILL